MPKLTKFGSPAIRGVVCNGRIGLLSASTIISRRLRQSMKIASIETFTDQFVGFVRVAADSGDRGWGIGLRYVF